MCPLVTRVPAMRDNPRGASFHLGGLRCKAGLAELELVLLPAGGGHHLAAAVADLAEAFANLLSRVLGITDEDTARHGHVRAFEAARAGQQDHPRRRVV